MPESSEIRIMSDFINIHSKNNFIKAMHVRKGNIPEDFELDGKFRVSSDFWGKSLILNLNTDISNDIKIWVFMGMNGNWKYVKTQNWNETKFCRLRLDDDTGHSLLLFGGFMGPKYSVGKPFTGTKRGVDPVKDFQNFKKNIKDNLDKKVFEKPLGEILLNQEYFNGVGAYLTAEIIGRLDIDPFRNLKSFSKYELEELFNMVLSCCQESYEYGGGELRSWNNPLGEGKIEEWIKFYNNKELCVKHKFGTRNIWIQKKFSV